MSCVLSIFRFYFYFLIRLSQAFQNIKITERRKMTSSITLYYSLSGSSTYESQLIMLTTAANCVKCSISWNKDITFIVICSIGS